MDPKSWFDREKGRISTRGIVGPGRLTLRILQESGREGGTKLYGGPTDEQRPFLKKEKGRRRGCGGFYWGGEEKELKQRVVPPSVRE